MKIVRQGDVLLMRVADHDVDVKVGAEVPREGGRVILAHGEVTGHSHAIAHKAAYLYELPPDMTRDGDNAALALDRILRLTRTVSLVHEEHGTIKLEQGNWRVRTQREYSPEELRNVQD